MILNRFRRKASLRPKTPVRDHSYEIFDFFTFRGVFFGRGKIGHEPGDRPQLFLLLSGGRIFPVSYDVDPVHTTGLDHTSFSFSHKVPGIADAAELGAAALIAAFKTEHMLIAQPGAGRLKADRFLTSESEFWQHVKANPTGRVLEIGSRTRSGISRRQLFPPPRSYVGFDIVAGENVDVVGDAHELASHFPPDHFDAVFSVSVWEHLAMPWKVSLELNRVMKPGALVMVNTHQSWPSHEEPWDYFRFSEFAWPALFNAATGFEIVAAGMGSPGVMAAALPQPELQQQLIEYHYGYLASRCVARKISGTALSWPVGRSSLAPGSYPN